MAAKKIPHQIWLREESDSSEDIKLTASFNFLHNELVGVIHFKLSCQLLQIILIVLYSVI